MSCADCSQLLIVALRAGELPLFSAQLEPPAPGTEVGPYHLLPSSGVPEVHFDDFDFPLRGSFQTMLFTPPHSLSPTPSLSPEL